MNILYIFLLAWLVTISGCDNSGGKYEISRVGNQTFLLNKANGETNLIDGTSLISVKKPDTAPSRKSKQWPDLQLPQIGEISVSIRTKYRDGQMLYIVNASPFQGQLKKDYQQPPNSFSHPTIKIDFIDSDYFKVGQPVELELRNATRVVNEKGEPTALTWTGANSMSAEAYLEITSQKLRWSGFSNKVE